MSRLPVRVLAVSNDALRPKLLDTMVHESDYNVIFVESIARAYSRIKQLQPDVIVLFTDIDDVDQCQLLSMLQVDRALRGLRVLACAAGLDSAAIDILPAFDDASENRPATAN